MSETDVRQELSRRACKYYKYIEKKCEETHTRTITEGKTKKVEINEYF